MTRLSVLLSCAVLAVGGVALTKHSVDGAPPSAPAAAQNRARVLMSSFHEIFSSATPADWATSADHIAEVTAQAIRGRR